MAARFNDRMTDVSDFYDRHPISEAQVLAALRRRRGALAGTPLTADDLFEFDQDHYGGLAAVDALARLAGIDARTRVLDLCAGLGGPARFLASRRGCRVVAVELNAGRAGGAERLTRLVRLHTRVRVVRGDATALPLGRARFDACLSQEALLHIADKAAVLRETHRVLAPGGRLAFTDWVARPTLGDGERRRLQEWMAATTLQTLAGYRTLLGAAGFHAVTAEDLADEWRAILRSRLEMFRAMREDTVARLGEARYREYDQLYGFFVGLIEAGKLGGGRFSATA
ncbi:MAG TPA: methyltransferase domain-containing protein [Candidatus Acidoferrum sp.]|nr:methyltransferase domain-containing protein [Candidatus Acidoferrum sp.]